VLGPVSPPPKVLWSICVLEEVLAGIRLIQRSRYERAATAFNSISTQPRLTGAAPHLFATRWRESPACTPPAAGAAQKLQPEAGGGRGGGGRFSVGRFGPIDRGEA